MSRINVNIVEIRAMDVVPILISRKVAVLPSIIGARDVRGRDIFRIFVLETCLKKSRKRIVLKMGGKMHQNLTILRSGIFPSIM